MPRSKRLRQIQIHEGRQHHRRVQPRQRCRAYGPSHPWIQLLRHRPTGKRLPRQPQRTDEPSVPCQRGVMRLRGQLVCPSLVPCYTAALGRYRQRVDYRLHRPFDPRFVRLEHPEIEQRIHPYVHDPVAHRLPVRASDQRTNKPAFRPVVEVCLRRFRDLVGCRSVVRRKIDVANNPTNPLRPAPWPTRPPPCTCEPRPVPHTGRCWTTATRCRNLGSPTGNSRSA
jgi:hypothetical protein